MRRQGGARAAIVAALSLAVLVGCGPPSEHPFRPGQPVAADFPAPEDYARAVVEATNNARAEQGLDALAWSECAAQIAAERARIVLPTGALDHPEGMLACDGATLAGENLVHGIYLPRQAVDAWLDSPGHRANILNPDFTSVGVACIATALDDPSRQATDAVGGMLCSQVFEGTLSD